jgi:hypothetical protein
MPRALGLLLALALAVALAIPAAAAADDDDGSRRDVRVTGTCSGSGDAELRVRERGDGELRVDLVLRTRQRGESWVVVIVHERRLAFRGRLQTSRSSGTISLRRTVRDLFGEDTVSVRASGPRGASCRAAATVVDS